MKGHVRKRGEKWCIVLDTKDERGLRRRKWHSGYRTRREAEAACAALITAMSEGRYSEPSKIGVGAYVRDCIAQWRSAGTITAKTEDRYSQLAANQVEPHLGARPLQKLSANEIAKWHVWMRTAGNKKDGSGVSHQTLKHAHALLTHCLNQAARHGMIAKNPAALERPRRPALQKSKVQIVAEDQIATLLEKLKGREPMRTKAILALFCGLRRSELLGLQWHDIDGTTLHVSRALEQTGGRIAVKGPKSQAGVRDISMPDIAVDALREHRRAQLELRIKLGMGRLADDGFVFANPLTGAPPSPQSLSVQWIATARSIGVPEVTFHSLRHSQQSRQHADPRWNGCGAGRPAARAFITDDHVVDLCPHVPEVG
jgi:integrase